MISRTERAKKLIKRSSWFGATFEEAPLRQMRDAQFISLEDKLRRLEEMNRLADEKAKRSAEKSE